MQNYPNPLNPSTTISYQMPHEGLVTLKVYDVLGNEVSKIFYGNLGEGYYEAEFDGSNYASGIYFYRINAGKFSQTKKMVLLK